MLEDSPASKTALMVAGYRALATSQPQPLFRDPWAAELAGREGVELARAFTKHFEHMELWIAVRTAFLDRQLTELAEREGFRQFVILGAGLDTRSARLAGEGRRFFEVDHPATQADKRARLSGLESYPVAEIGFAPCDFEAEASVIDALQQAGLDAAEPAMVIWEGVTPYLQEAAVLATARQLAEGLHPESVLLFDYVNKRLAQSQEIRREDQAVKDMVGDLGEPIRWGTDDPLPLLHQAGYRHIRSLSFDEACLSLTHSYDRKRQFRFQRIAWASRSTWPRV